MSKRPTLEKMIQIIPDGSVLLSTGGGGFTFYQSEFMFQTDTPLVQSVYDLQGAESVADFLESAFHKLMEIEKEEDDEDGYTVTIDWNRACLDYPETE
jgi:hypothetical protein